MEIVEFRAGDIFCTASSSWLGRAIRFFQRLWELDDSALHNHAGVMVNYAGKTLEALSGGVVFSDLAKYRGQLVLVGRHVDMTTYNFKRGMVYINDHIGDSYPYWRLVLHSIPVLGKYVSSGKFAVCSELVAKFLLGSGVRFFTTWRGCTPGYLSDAIVKWDAFDVVADGVLGVDWAYEQMGVN